MLLLFVSLFCFFYPSNSQSIVWDAMWKPKTITNQSSSGPHSIVLVMSTHNRQGYVDTSAHNLAVDPAVTNGLVDLVIFDDASTMYGVSELKRWFPKATMIKRFSQHQKSNVMDLLKCRWFLNSTYNLIK